MALAVAHLRQAIVLDDGYSQAHFYLGVAYQALGKQDEAIAAFERALAATQDEEMRAEIQRHMRRIHDSG
jgi:tetratricopeptide (TPR) repeat protein